MAWMGSENFLQSRFCNMPEGRYAHETLCSLEWWDNVKFVVDSIQLLFAFLRFADEDKIGTLSEVLLRYNLVKSEYESIFSNNPAEYQRYMAVIDARMHDIANKTYINAGKFLKRVNCYCAY